MFNKFEDVDMSSITKLDLSSTEHVFNYKNQAIALGYNVSELTEMKIYVDNAEEHAIKVKNPLNYIKNDIFLGTTDCKQNFTVNQIVEDRTAVENIYLTNDISPIAFMKQVFCQNAEELNSYNLKTELFSEFSPAMLNNNKKIGIFNKSPKKAKKTKIYKCNIVKCTESFNTEYNMVMHKLKHKKCHHPNCKSILLDTTDLQIHNKEVHGL